MLLTIHFKALLKRQFYYQKYIKSFTIELLADFLGRSRILWRQVSRLSSSKNYKITRFTVLSNTNECQNEDSYILYSVLCLILIAEELYKCGAFCIFLCHKKIQSFRGGKDLFPTTKLTWYHLWHFSFSKALELVFFYRLELVWKVSFSVYNLFPIRHFLWLHFCNQMSKWARSVMGVPTCICTSVYVCDVTISTPFVECKFDKQ